MGEQIGDGFVDSPFLFSSSRHSYSPFPTHKNYCNNCWKQNHGNRPRILPKLIFGTIQINTTTNPWRNFDLRLALKPYDIPWVPNHNYVFVTRITTSPLNDTFLRWNFELKFGSFLVKKDCHGRLPLKKLLGSTSLKSALELIIIYHFRWNWTLVIRFSGYSFKEISHLYTSSWSFNIFFRCKA